MLTLALLAQEPKPILLLAVYYLYKCVLFPSSLSDPSLQGQCKVVEGELREQLRDSEERRERDVSALGENLTRLRIEGEQKRMQLEKLEEANSQLKTTMAGM